MTYTPDANELAEREARRLQEHEALVPASSRPRYGRFKVWSTANEMLNGIPPLLEWARASVEHHTGYLVVRSDEDTAVEVLFPVPGWYLSFEPVHEGE